MYSLKSAVPILNAKTQPSLIVHFWFGSLGMCCGDAHKFCRPIGKIQLLAIGIPLVSGNLADSTSWLSSYNPVLLRGLAVPREYVLWNPPLWEHMSMFLCPSTSLHSSHSSDGLRHNFSSSEIVTFWVFFKVSLIFQSSTSAYWCFGHITSCRLHLKQTTSSTSTVPTLLPLAVW